MIKYPAQIDDGYSLPVTTQQTGIRPDVFNQLREAIIKVEAELGTKPSSTYGTVKARLDYIEGITSQQLVLLSGDLGGAVDDVKVIGLQGRSVKNAMPLNSQVLYWDGIENNWKPKTIDMDSLSVPLVAILTPNDPIIVELNSTLTNPSFTADYTTLTGNLTSVTLIDDQGNVSEDVTATPTSFSYNNSYTKSTFGDQVVFTLSATDNNAITKTTKATFTWGQKLYWGAREVDTYNSNFITSLSDNEITLSVEKTFTVDAGAANNYIYFACRHAYGTPTFTVNGLDGGFSLAATVTVNAELYDLYVSDQLELGITTITVS